MTKELSKSAVETARRREKIAKGELKFVSLTLPTHVLEELDEIAKQFIVNRKPSRPEAIKQLVKFYKEKNERLESTEKTN